MKILHLISYYYPHIGGMEQVARDVVEALKEGNEQLIFCFNHEKGNTEDEVDGVKVMRSNCQAKVASQSLSLSYGKRLKKAIRGFKPDVIFFHYPNPFSAHYLLKYIPKDCKLVLYWHLDITKQKILKKFFVGQNKRLCKRADRVIGATNLHLECSEFYNYFKDKCEVLPYRIDEKRLVMTTDDIAKAERIRQENTGKTLLFAMGRHVPYKGLEYLIRASKLLDDNYAVYIAGQGPLTDSLKELAKDDKKVVFLGKIDDGDRRAYLSACDIFCFPSITRNEGFGLALAEAMYFSKPAVTFYIYGSGVNFVSLNNVTGIEVENGNVEQYALAIKKLAEDNDLREAYGKAARRRVLEHFTAEQFSKNINKLVIEITK